MRVTFQRAGGVGAFPGLSAPVTLEADSLSAEDAEALKGLIAQTRFFELATPAAPARGADRRSYVIAVEDGGRQRTLRLWEPVPSELEPLIHRLEGLARRKRRP